MEITGCASENIYAKEDGLALSKTSISSDSRE